MRNMLKTVVFFLVVSFISMQSSNVSAEGNLILLLPNGGEVITSGTVYTLQWDAPPDAVQFDLMFSRDEGMTWELIRDGVTNTSYDWYVATSTSTENRCLVKVTGYNSSGERIGEDGSDMTFTIAAES